MALKLFFSVLSIFDLQHCLLPTIKALLSPWMPVSHYLSASLSSNTLLEADKLTNTHSWFFHSQFSSVQSLSRVPLFVTPWTTARQASLSITNSWSLLKLMSIKSVMPSSHLILCRPLLLLPPIPPSIRVFSNESALRMRWPKYRSFSSAPHFMFFTWQSRVSCQRPSTSVSSPPAANILSQFYAFRSSRTNLCFMVVDNGW